MRDWSREEALRRHPIATFLVTENLTELHPLLAQNPDASLVQIPLPAGTEIARGIDGLAKPEILGDFSGSEGRVRGTIGRRKLEGRAAIVALEDPALDVKIDSGGSYGGIYQSGAFSDFAIRALLIANYLLLLSRSSLAFVRRFVRL